MSDQRKANAANSSNSSISNNNKLEDPGVYMNCRLMHSFTSLIGATVEVELMGGERYEGIFKTFSPKVSARCGLFILFANYTHL